MRPSELVERARTRNPLPEGTLAVGAGLMVGGVTAYGYLVIAGRVLGDGARFAPLASLWFLAFLAGPGFFLPLEQEVGRAIAARRARGLGGGPVIRRAAVAGGLLAIGLVVATLAGSGVLLEYLFDDEGLLLVGFVMMLVGYFFLHLTRGTLSGNGRFGPYGVLIGAEGIVRVLGCAALAVFGVERAGPYGLFLGIAPFVAIALVLPRTRGVAAPGPEAPWAELSTALGYLLVGAVLAQTLINAAPLAAKVLASDAENAVAGHFASGFIVARIPVFLFQAVQAALLPKLAALAAAGKHADFRNGLWRLLRATMGFGVLVTIAAPIVGPWAIRVLFGPEFDLGRRDLGLLAAASSVNVVGLVIAQALIALGAHSRAALGWIVGVVGFLVVTALGSDLLLRVELGYLAGSVVSASVMAVFLHQRLRAAITSISTEELIAGVAAIEP